MLLQYRIFVQYSMNHAMFFATDKHWDPNCGFHREKIHASSVTSTSPVNYFKAYLKPNPIILVQQKYNRRHWKYCLSKDVLKYSTKIFSISSQCTQLAPSIHYLAILSLNILQDWNNGSRSAVFLLDISNSANYNPVSWINYIPIHQATLPMPKVPESAPGAFKMTDKRPNQIFMRGSSFEITHISNLDAKQYQTVLPHSHVFKQMFCYQQLKGFTESWR